jgi:hypothetical protein
LTLGGWIADAATRSYEDQVDDGTAHDFFGQLSALEIERVGLPTDGIISMAMCRAAWIRAIAEDFRAVVLLDHLLHGDPVDAIERAWLSSVFNVNAKPAVGSIAVWEHSRSIGRKVRQAFRREDGSKGRAGLVVAVNPAWAHFHTLEAFKLPKANELVERPGFKITRKARPIDRNARADGMRLLGFIHPPSGIGISPVAFIREE